MTSAPRPEAGRRNLQRVAAQDALLAAVGTVVALLPLGIPALELGEVHHVVPPWMRIALVLLQTVPLGLSRRAPLCALAVGGCSWAIAQVVGADTGLAGLALVVLLYYAGRHADRRRVLTIVIGSAAYVALALTLVAIGSPERPVDWFTFWVVLAAPWSAGAAVRNQQQRQVEQSRLLATRAVSDARGAIARDLHDVVTHHVTAMIVQAESTAYATEHLADDDRSAALTTIGEGGRAALRELRALLDTLDPDGAASSRSQNAPSGPADVRSLVDRLKATGYPVTLAIPEQLELAAVTAAVVHDVAREAVTNAMRHAPGMDVTVRVEAVADGIVLTVENDLPDSGDTASSRSGRGRRIMRDRVAAVGGTLRSEPYEAGGGQIWRTVARLPSAPVGTGAAS